MISGPKINWRGMSNALGTHFTVVFTRIRSTLKNGDSPVTKTTRCHSAAMESLAQYKPGLLGGLKTRYGMGEPPLAGIVAGTETQGNVDDSQKPYTIWIMSMPTRPSKQTFASNVRRFRRARQMTQVRLAEVLRVDQSRIAELERGKGNPTMDTLDEIADALEVSPASLLVPVEIQEPALA